MRSEKEKPTDISANYCGGTHEVRRDTLIKGEK
jgi:hypothetical protein